MTHIENGLFECSDCGRTWRGWYGLTVVELSESMERHETALAGHRVYFTPQPHAAVA